MPNYCNWTTVICCLRTKAAAAVYVNGVKIAPGRMWCRFTRDDHIQFADQDELVARR